MTITVGDPATIGEKELRNDWPNEEGIIAGTTKRDDEPASLEAEEVLITSTDKWGCV